MNMCEVHSKGNVVPGVKSIKLCHLEGSALSFWVGWSCHSCYAPVQYMDERSG